MNILSLFKKSKKITSYNFDWDDNILFMPTKIIITHKTTKEEVELSTEEFAHVRKEVGVEGKYADYEIVNDENSPHFSFKQFRDFDKNNFLPQVIETLKNPNCYGPSFKRFQEACSSQETANNTTIITARGHNPESMLEGLVYMRDIGLIKHLPPLENIYPCSSPKIKANATHPSDKKLEILINLIDEVQAKTCPKSVASFGFSDDDKGTYNLVHEKLAQKIEDGHWNNVKIVLYFTGKNPEKRVLSISKVA